MRRRIKYKQLFRKVRFTVNILKKTAALLALILVLSLAACGGDKKDDSSNGGNETQTQQPAGNGGSETKEPEQKSAGSIGVCIYKFDDAFMTTYRNALEKILKEKGYRGQERPHHGGKI